MAPAPAIPVTERATSSADVGPHPSFVQVARPYIFQQQISYEQTNIGTIPAREDQYRLQGVQWINDVRKALQLPVRTFDTAVTYFHKFRLSHRDTEYLYQDATAAALLTACKIEDTLKKSRDVLCAAHNVTVKPSEHLSPDDPLFEAPSKIVIGLERLMLESSGFDFRSKYPQKHLIKLAKVSGLTKEVAAIAYKMMIDLYRTFAPLKQTCSAMAFACVELAGLVTEQQPGREYPEYNLWCVTRPQVLETMLDLLDIYTHYQKSSIIGPLYPTETFINIAKGLTKELQESQTHRFTDFVEGPNLNGLRGLKTPKTPITPASPADARNVNGNGNSAASPAAQSPGSAASSRNGHGAKVQNGTVRFMLDSEQANREKQTVSEYFKNEYEDYEVEVEEALPAPTQPSQSHGQVRGAPSHFQRGRDYRGGHGSHGFGGGGYNTFDNKRARW